MKAYISLFQNEVVNVMSRFHRFLGDLGRILIADDRIQSRNDSAAIATLLAYGLMTALAAWMGRGTVPVRPEYRRIAVFVAMAALIYFLTKA